MRDNFANASLLNLPRITSSGVGASYIENLSISFWFGCMALPLVSGVSGIVAIAKHLPFKMHAQTSVTPPPL